MLQLTFIPSKRPDNLDDSVIFVGASLQMDIEVGREKTADCAMAMATSNEVNNPIVAGGMGDFLVAVSPVIEEGLFFVRVGNFCISISNFPVECDKMHFCCCSNSLL